MSAKIHSAPQRLLGHCVALTGRLASLSREDARRLVRAQGGRFGAAVSRETTLLIVGQEGWPLRKDGRLTGNLRRTRELQAAGHALEVLGEQEFLERLGLDQLAGGVCGRHTLTQLARLLGVPPSRIQGWIRQGLLEPVETIEGLPLFDFRQVAALKALCELQESGVSTSRLRRSLKQLSTWLPDADDALARLSAVEGQLLVRDHLGGLAEPNGQKRLEFQRGDAAEPDERVVSLASPVSQDELFQIAVEHEEAGRLESAGEMYRRWLHEFGPDARVCFNLANVLTASGHDEGAIERLRQAVELDTAYVEAWNNLGAALAKTGQRQQALAAFAHALEHEPAYADALYNMADTLDELHRADEAQRYWRAYLACDAASPWADYARGRLAR